MSRAYGVVRSQHRKADASSRARKYSQHGNRICSGRPYQVGVMLLMGDNVSALVTQQDASTEKRGSVNAKHDDNSTRIVSPCSRVGMCRAVRPTASVWNGDFEIRRRGPNQ